ncbi:AAA family ATPase [Streptomyces noursei]|uniref:AAA+ ATPase domain-containing protein n=1 Tax=Streptomyces noursei TaxID=1971 RepID=A0A2N8PFR5_STRNR|nr:ATP-binding protein [Streptomyces noursei]PNE39867.1 hypothetical protein AOB60_01655 [Streptomyces noursei]
MTASQHYGQTEGGPAAADQDAGLDHLLGWLSLVERRVYRAVVTRMALAPQDAPDPLRGLYISDEAVAWLCRNPTRPLERDPRELDLLAGVEKEADAAEAGGSHLPLRELTTRFGLSALDVEVLLTALAPEIDPRYERFYSYLHDDVNRQCASVALALQLCGLPAHAGAARARFTHGPLVNTGLVRVEDMERPLLSRTLRVSDRAVSYLLGHSAPPDSVSGMCLVGEAPPLPAAAGHLAEETAALLERGQLVYLRGRPDSAVDSAAAAAAQHSSGQAIRVDPCRLPPSAEARYVIKASVLEARLRGCGLHIGPLPHSATTTEPPWQGVQGLLQPLQDTGVPTVITGQAPWNPTWCTAVPVILTCPPMSSQERATVWRSELRDMLPSDAVDHAIHAMAAQRLSPIDLRTTVCTAYTRALATGTALDAPTLQAAARLRHGSALEQLARRVEPTTRLTEVVLPDLPRNQLHSLVTRVKHRERVFLEWGMRPGSSRGTGISALFTGDSGTGKTFAAEALAAELGLDLYIINLATLVDKYIGETEKNLERVFTHAEGLSAVLLFDEADAIFGKRTETTQAHDRYANIETAYLLQRLESFDGIAILTTNLAANIDTAFTRRLDLIIHFPSPDTHHRHLLWDHCLGTKLPRSPDLDIDHLARTFDLTGGSIRNCTITAAYHTATTGQPLSTKTILDAIRAEYLKLGRLINDDTTPHTHPPSTDL